MRRMELMDSGTLGLDHGPKMDGLIKLSTGLNLDKDRNMDWSRPTMGNTKKASLSKLDLTLSEVLIL